MRSCPNASAHVAHPGQILGFEGIAWDGDLPTLPDMANDQISAMLSDADNSAVLVAIDGF